MSFQSKSFQSNSFQSDPLADGSHSAELDPAAFRGAMRHLAGGVSVISVGRGEARTGLTATSFSAFSAEPPRVLVCVNKTSSSYPVLVEEQQFGANLLAAQHDDIASRFSGRGGIKGPARYEGGAWRVLPSGVSVLSDALASFDCAVEELIERHSHVIVIGRVRAIHSPGGSAALVYWRGAYDQLGWTQDQLEKAVGLAR